MKNNRELRAAFESLEQAHEQLQRELQARTAEAASPASIPPPEQRIEAAEVLR